MTSHGCQAGTSHSDSLAPLKGPTESFTSGSQGRTQSNSWTLPRVICMLRLIPLGPLLCHKHFHSFIVSRPRGLSSEPKAEGGTKMGTPTLCLPQASSSEGTGGGRAPDTGAHCPTVPVCPAAGRTDFHDRHTRRRPVHPAMSLQTSPRRSRRPPTIIRPVLHALPGGFLKSPISSLPSSRSPLQPPNTFSKEAHQTPPHGRFCLSRYSLSCQIELPLFFPFFLPSFTFISFMII